MIFATSFRTTVRTHGQNPKTFPISQYQPCATVHVTRHPRMCAIDARLGANQYPSGTGQFVPSSHPQRVETAGILARSHSHRTIVLALFFDTHNVETQAT